MNPLGFSTGALAKGEFHRGIELQANNPRVSAIELSALREHELGPLVADASRLPLSRFKYVSFHAPSKLTSTDEKSVFDLLSSLPVRWPIIVHPELLRTPSHWRSLGSRLCLENMDNRKTTGRTLDEMRGLLDAYPEATFCLDLGHARQIDPTMATAIRMLKMFRNRLQQIHISEIGPRGEHRNLSSLAIYAYELITDLVPDTCPIIIESVIKPEEIEREIDNTTALFTDKKTRHHRSLGSWSYNAV